MKRLMLACLISAVSWTTAAEDITQYKVELIVFENLDPAAKQAEQWPDRPGLPSLDNAMEPGNLSAVPAPVPAPNDSTSSVVQATDAGPVQTEQPTDTTTPPPWRWLTPEEFSLNDVMRRLGNAKRYHPLLHIGWIQPLDSTDQGTPVHIYEDMRPGESDAAAQAQEPVVLPSPIAILDDGQPAESPSTSPVSPETSSGQTTDIISDHAPHRLDGTFTLRRGRYLHVDVDLAYRGDFPVQETLPDGTGLSQTISRVVRMTQSRRLRSDEVHYLDHPLFGVIFKISPYEPASEEQPAAK